MKFTENTTMQELFDNVNYWEDIPFSEPLIFNDIYINIPNEDWDTYFEKRNNRKYIASRKNLIKDKRSIYYRALPVYQNYSKNDIDIINSKIVQLDNLMVSVVEKYPTIVWTTPVKIEASIRPYNNNYFDLEEFVDIGNFVTKTLFRSLYKKDPLYPTMPLETYIKDIISTVPQENLSYSTSYGDRKTVIRNIDFTNNNKLFYGRKVYDNRFCNGVRLLPRYKSYWENYEGVGGNLEKLVFTEQLEMVFDTYKFYADWEMIDMEAFYDLEPEVDISDYPYTIGIHNPLEKLDSDYIFEEWWNEHITFIRF